jgi:cytochrome c-type biogenesis protein CcmH
MRAALLFATLLIVGNALAIDAERLDDPVMQARYESLLHELRCLVCQNETIADSNATLAADLRRELRDMMKAGKTDAEIRAFLTERYGDFVLYMPPVSPRTWLLWAAPALLLFGGVAFAALVVVRRARTARANPAALEEEPDKS